MLAEQRRDLLEIMEDRHGRGSTIVTSQLPVEHWHEIIGDPTIADAVLDRLVHNAHRLTLKGESLRKAAVHSASVRSERSIFRMRAHGLCRPTARQILSLNSTSTSNSSPSFPCNGADNIARTTSVLLSCNSGNSILKAFDGAKSNTTCGYCCDIRSAIAGRIPADIDSEQPMRTSPTVGSAKNSISLTPSRSSSKATRPRCKIAVAYIVGSTPRGLRSNNRTLSACSSPATDCDTADCVRPRWPAALAMLPCWTTANRICRSRSVTRRPIRLSQSTLLAISFSNRLPSKTGLLLLSALANCSTVETSRKAWEHEQKSNPNVQVTAVQPSTATATLPHLRGPIA